MTNPNPQMEAQIKAEFEKSGFSLSQEPGILQKCLAYCINYKLSASDLVSHWDLYRLNKELYGSTVESSDMDGFLSHLQNDQKANDIKEEAHLHIYSSNDVDMLLSGERDNGNGNELRIYPNQYEGSTLDSFSPTRLTFDTNENLSSKKTSKPTVNLITPFGQRSNKFVSLYSFNASHEADVGTKDENLDVSEDDIIRRVKSNERCSLNIHCSRPEPCCRFMYDRTEFKFNYLENRISRYTSMFAACGLYGEPTIASMASEKYIFAVGMICCDGEGHLNEKSILLQGSLEHSGGERVHLDLQKLPELSLFPGQVIGVEGQNPSGHYLIASKVVDALPVAPDAEYPPPKKQVLELETSSSSKALSLMIASGPFTTTDNLLFEPLAELLAYARRKQPQIVILMGPFVDSEHPDIKMGRVDRAYDDIFNVEILRKLLDYVEYMGPTCRVVLSPSTRDAHHISIFPQPAFNTRGLEEINDQITCLTNPCTFSANEVMFGCTTTDILKHLSSEEISRILPNSSSGDRMGRLAGHVLRQRSFYPLYPPATVFPLDTSLAPEALEIPSVPDVLLLPSDLAPFIKVLPVDENRQGEDVVRCMCVNPGRLAKGIGGGTFVEMAYNGDPDKTTAAIIRI